MSTSLSFLPRLAMKNLARNKKRIALSLVSVIAGVSVYILGQGFVTGLKENILRAQIDQVSSHVAILPADYPTDALSAPIDGLFEVDAAAEAWLSDNAVAWTRRLQFRPEAIAGVDAVRLRGVVYDPTADGSVFDHDAWQVEGALPNNDGVMLGQGAATLLGVEPGGFVTLRTRTVNGAINALELRVLGVLRTGNPMLDTASVLLPWGVAEPLLRNGEATSHLHVRISDRDEAAAAGEALSAVMGPETGFVTWQSETAEIIRLQDLRQMIFTVLSWALLLMAATGIANTLLRAAYERVQEIGTLRAMGMTRRAVISLFVIEGSMLGVVGGLIGTVLGGAAVYYWSIEGIDLAALMEGQEEAMANLPMSTVLYMNFDPTALAIGFGFGLGFAVLASIYPAFAASQMSPAEAVRA